LSDRAKILMAKCDPAHTVSYQTIKKFLLQKLHLSASVYLDKFNSLVQEKDEPLSQYSNRLLSLFTYYVESRKINRDFEKLVDLIIYDKIKSQLVPFQARHVSALEAAHKDGWLGCLGLVEALDAYMASAQKMPMSVPRVSSGLNAVSGNKVLDVHKPSTGKVEPVTARGRCLCRVLALVSGVLFVHRHNTWLTCVHSYVAVRLTNQARNLL